MKKYIYILFILFSCSEYQKILKSDDINYKYDKAIKYYQNNDYDRALPLLNELSKIMIGTSKMEEISYYFAYCHYATGDNLMAAYLFKQYVQNYINGKYTQECSFMSAYCYYLESPNYSLDPTNNYKAIKELQNHIYQFPNSDKIEECNSLIDELRGKLAKKAFKNAKQYYITENYKSSIIALNNLLIDFPSFNNREEVFYLIVKSSYLLAINSISSKIEQRLQETLNVYDQFTSNFPNSKYLKELKSTYIKTQENLTKLKNKENEI